MKIGSSPKTILVLGGYGSFGSRLCRLLSQHTKHLVLVAGRSQEKANAHCETYGGEPVKLDRQTITESTLNNLSVDILVDASGPFSCDEADAYGLVKLCLTTATHYIDLSDDPDFTSGISRFNTAATSKNLFVTSGASTVPAVSGAIADSLTHDLHQIEFIESTILPGNKAPRGLSVIQSIVHQAGRPFSGWIDGGQKQLLGWSDQKQRAITVSPSRKIRPRWSALVATPDTKLMPERFASENVAVRAGLELSIMHLGLYALTLLPRLGLIRTLRPLAQLLRRMAELFLPFGSDEGGMRVDVGGRTGDGSLTERTWMLHAGSGEGPYIPAIPAFILCTKIADDRVEPGADPCLGKVSAEDLESALRLIDTGTATNGTDIHCLFEQALGDDWHLLPEPIRGAHSAIRRRAFHGHAKVERGTSALAHLVCTLFRFPPNASATPVHVAFERRVDKEIWHRTFGTSSFRSVLKIVKAGTGLIQERFGLFTFHIPLQATGQALRFPVLRGFILGLPIPAFLLPKSNAREFVDASGRFNFEIDLSLPMIGRIVRYEGWLKPAGRSNPRTCQQAD